MFEGFSAIYVVYAGGRAHRHHDRRGAATCSMPAAATSRTAINRRMKLQENKISQEQVLIQLRKERGLEAGASRFSLDRFRALRTQSGMVMPLPKFLTITSGVAFALALVAIWYGLPLLMGLLLFVVLLPVLPVKVMRFQRNRRQKRFGMQLPEALELITRGLKAGHPVPVAIAMVSREMPDPIGTEFGVVADEVTYGSDLVSALNALYRPRRPRGSAAVRHRRVDPDQLGRQSARDPGWAVDDDPRPRQAAPQGARHFDRRPHVGLHPDGGAGAAVRRHHGADAAVLSRCVG